MQIHQQLKQARLDAGLSQLQLAELTGMKQEAISRAESGALSVKTVERILKALKLKIVFVKE